MSTFGPLPARFVDLKREIAASYPDFQARATAAWNDLLGELKVTTAQIAEQGSNIVPIVEFSDINKMTDAEKQTIRRKGCLVVRNVIDDEEVAGWRAELQEYVKINPVAGFPEPDKQFFQLYWTGPQVRARSHPNVLTIQEWLNKMFHVDAKNGVQIDLSPVSYADRFRMRHPGGKWDNHPPHVDGGAIERWEDPTFRSCFEDILNGEWRKHDPYDITRRMNATTSMYGRDNQTSVFRTYQGWLALGETGPNQGTLQVFPDILLANSYIILRPFFSPISQDAEDFLSPDNWKFDISYADFPGILTAAKGFNGPLPTTATHPHLRLEQTMVSIPAVQPGDFVFWHSDLIHAVEVEHVGKEDSSVMYISAVPSTPKALEYMQRQKEAFLKGLPPPDFPQWEGEAGFKGLATLEDMRGEVGRKAMGFSA